MVEIGGTPMPVGQWVIIGLWALPWVVLGLIFWNGGWGDIHATDRHYGPSGRFLGSTLRKTGEAYVPPNRLLAVRWVIGYPLVTSFTCAMPFDFRKRPADEPARMAAMEAEGRRDAALGFFDSEKTSLPFGECYRAGFGSGVVGRTATARKPSAGGVPAGTTGTVVAFGGGLSTFTVQFDNGARHEFPDWQIEIEPTTARGRPARASRPTTRSRRRSGGG